MFRIPVEGSVRWAVEDLGARMDRAIIFVHGWPFDHNIFESQLTVLPRYGIRCIGVDLRGFGQSDRPVGGYGYNRLADDLYSLICGLDCRSVTLCGHSMGAAVCIRYMARHCGQRVGRLVLMGAAAPSFVQRPGYPYGMTTQQVDSLIDEAYANRPQLCASFARRCFSSNPGSEYLNWIAGIGERAAGWSTIRSAESLRDEDLRGDLQKIRVPTAILHGVRDQVCPYQFAGELNRGIAGSFVIPFEHSGHALFHEERDKCNSSLVDFVTTPY